MITLYGKEIPEPDGKLGDFRLPKEIYEHLDTFQFMRKDIISQNLRWKRKEDMENVVDIFYEFNERPQ